jgi:hypothetical protein
MDIKPSDFFVLGANPFIGDYVVLGVWQATGPADGWKQDERSSGLSKTLGTMSVRY